ncbi:MAG: hypothetical protein PHT51_04565 [Patescibacteria group bacterium]|nr:hypothetical protein [Patescibacteria group bacterium]
MGWIILRPGVIVAPGVLSDLNPDFMGYHGYAFVLYNLTRIIRKKWADPVLQEQLKRANIAVSDERIFCPLNIGFSSTATVNIIPLPWTAKTAVLLCEKGLSGKVYHLTHPHPPFTREMALFTAESLGIYGLTVGMRGVSHVDPVLAKMQNGLDGRLAYLKPYTMPTVPVIFEHGNCAQDLGPDYEEPIVFGKREWEKRILWALKYNFGLPREV